MNFKRALNYDSLEGQRWNSLNAVQTSEDINSNEYVLRSELLTLTAFHDHQLFREFMKELERDKKKIMSCTLIFIPADKTRNYYEMHPSDYTKLLTENGTKSYKHAQEHIATNIADYHQKTRCSSVKENAKLSSNMIQVCSTKYDNWFLSNGPNQHNVLCYSVFRYIGRYEAPWPSS